MTKNFLFLYPDPVNADAFVMDGLGVLKDAAAFFNDTDGSDIFFRAAEHHFFHSPSGEKSRKGLKYQC